MTVETALRIFKTKIFEKFAKKERLSNPMLCEAVEGLENGLIDADLGGCIIKQRIGRKGQGKSGGYRVLIAVREKKRYVFMDGFAKNEKANITDDELFALKKYGLAWLNADEKIIDAALKTEKLIEVKYETKKT